MKIVCINENPSEWVNNNNNQIKAIGGQRGREVISRLVLDNVHVFY
jgi:hypothetical protein